MGKKRRKFERQVLERLQAIEDDLALLSQPVVPQEPVHNILYGYTCACGIWVPFGQTHVCPNYWSTPNTCGVSSISDKRPDLKIV